jgi:hypothetical protein
VRHHGGSRVRLVEIGDDVARKGRARRFREARELKQGFDDGLFQEGSGSLADLENKSEDDEDELDDAWDDDKDDDEYDPLYDPRDADAAPRAEGGRQAS